MKLRTHLIILTLATVVPAVLLAAALVVYHMRLERASLERGMRDTARALALVLDREISDIKTGVERLSASRHLDGSVDLARFYEEAATASQAFGGWAVLSDPSGRQILNTSRPLGSALPIPTMAGLEMMRSVAEGRNTVVSSVLVGIVSRQPAVIVSVPVIRDGQVRYVLDCPFPPAQLSKLLQEASLSRGWIGLVTDRDGGVVARAPDAAVFVGRKEGPSWTTPTAGADEGFMKGDLLRGPSVYAAYRRSKATDWVVGVAAPVRLVDAGIRRSMLAVASGGVLLVALACGLAYVLAQRIGAPIAGLAESLEVEGETPLPPVPSIVSEVEDLRRALEDARVAAHRAERARAAQYQAEAATRARDEFLTVLSDELRTPLNATFGWVRMLRSGPLEGGAAAHALEVIERNVTQQSRLIGDLLDATRIVFGRLELHLQAVDLPALVASVVASIRPTAEIKTIGLKSDLDADAGPVNGDPERLRQVVESILGNAVKFTPPNGTVTVRLARDGDAVLTVSDTGRGIDPELLPHVFERFKQVDAATPRGRGGLGLGLAIASHLVELHGGRVRAESAGIGQGATFTVVLPVVTKASAPAAAQQLELAMPGRERLDGARVLIVEDDADTRELVATVLGQAGAVIFTASDVWDGIAMAPRVRPNVVVCDLAMPGQDGPALVREVKAWAAEAGVALAALALTADARAGDRDETVAVGYDLYLTKPVEPSELVRAIARLARR